MEEEEAQVYLLFRDLNFRLDRHYDNMIQSGAQYAADKLGAWSLNTKNHIMRQGEELHRNLRNYYNQTNMSDNYFRLRQLSGERVLDRNLL